MKQRDITYDLMKGVAVLLMMASHLALNVGLPKLIIYSFHMPLFFILAGVFAKDFVDISSFKDYTGKNAKRLLLPFVVTMLMLCAWGGVQAFAKHNVGFFMRPFLSMVSATADGYDSAWGLIYVGPIWFLVALFWVRELFSGIQCAFMRVNKYGDEWIVGVSVVLSVVSVVVHPYLPALPFSIMQAFTALGFYAVGWYVHKHPMPWWIFWGSVVVWPFAFVYGEVDIACCKVDYYPLSFVGACGGTYVVYLLCKGWAWVLNKKPYIVSPLTWCGVYSLPILCMHTFDMSSDIFHSVMLRLPFNFDRLWEMAVAIVLALGVMKVPYLKEVFLGKR